jgi:hypothetical protein
MILGLFSKDVREVVVEVGSTDVTLVSESFLRGRGRGGFSCADGGGGGAAGSRRSEAERSRALRPV